MSETTVPISAAAAGDFRIAGDLPVARLGYGSMQLPGANAFGPTRDAENARRVLRRAVELGVTLIDTADAYGPEVAETLIGEALSPYPDELVVATKGGFVRGSRGEWIVNGQPEHLRAAVRESLRRLRMDRIDLYQLHRVDPHVPLADQIGALAELRDEGLILHIGLSEVTVDQLREAERIAPIVTVQNRYNLADRSSEELVRHTAERGIGFIPWFPLATGGLTHPTGPLGAMAQRTGASPSQLALAWLLQHSPNILPIPGTASAAHLEENVLAAELELSAGDVAILDGAA